MFCQSCGAEMSGAFCSKCGAPAPQAQYGQPLQPGTKPGGGMKILFVVLGILAVLGMLFVGAIMYGVRKVKQVASANGVDLNSFSETRSGPARRLDACELLTKEDLSQILSVTVERSESSGRSTHSVCRYYSTAAQQRGSAEAAASLKKLQDTIRSGGASGATPAQQQEALKHLEMLAHGAGETAGTGNGPVLKINVETANAKASMAGFKLGLGLASRAISGGEQGKQKALREEIAGVGDGAMMGPLMSIFMFRKGDVAVQIDGRLLPGGRDAQIAIAKRIIERL